MIEIKQKKRDELLITHHIKDTKIYVDEKLNYQVNGDYILLGEFCEYNNCEFIIDFEEKERVVAFEECKFINCTFTNANGKKNKDIKNINLDFTTCEFEDITIQNGFKNVYFKYTSINKDYCDDKKLHDVDMYTYKCIH